MKSFILTTLRDTLIRKFFIFILLAIFLLSSPLLATIKVGFLLDLSGPTAKLCQAYTSGIKNYFDDLNKRGGVNGDLVELIVKDTKYQPLVAIKSFYELN